ncbi:dolichyl-phosphate beta-glucosyltransferase [Saprospira grandis]|uniref:dolichyl-phosphate beta-glucosyltransferase n=1 Tax=Saprospira grandis TaxID=1008 RepID=UPI0022DD4903|nr:dolichyl-phosphate beta-glucosyltransferase [Saprospira grandis]WBM75762.1 glycosyltransferase family 2 protein [Saprospira grandis]
MLSQSCLIVVPCYNEAERLALDEFRAALARWPNLQFLFVNDGSQDDTWSILSTFAQEEEGALALDLPKNGGKAEAVRQGMLEALLLSEAQYIGFFDADLATPLSEIECLAQGLERNPNRWIAAGSRVRRLGSQIERKPMRHYLGRIFATVVSILLGISIYDSQCGAKLFRRQAVETLFEDLFISAWFFDVELFARLITKGPKLPIDELAYEQPLRKWKEVGGSKIKATTFLKAPWELFRIYRHYFK